MLYKRFEDLPVWNDAADLLLRVFELTKTGALSPYGDARNQMERSALSVSNNIAEGFERGSKKEQLTFYYIARGSAGEVRSMAVIFDRVEELAPHRPLLRELRSKSESIGRQLGRWIETIKDSRSRGPRYQNARTRQAAEAARRRDPSSPSSIASSKRPWNADKLPTLPPPRYRLTPRYHLAPSLHPADDSVICHLRSVICHSRSAIFIASRLRPSNPHPTMSRPLATLQDQPWRSAHGDA